MTARILITLAFAITIAGAQISWDPPQAIGPQLGTRLATIADINMDGIPDYVASSPTFSGGPLGATAMGRITAFSGVNNALLWNADGSTIGDGYGFALGLADVTGDGVDEVITVRQHHLGVGTPPMIEVIDAFSGSVINTLVVPGNIPWLHIGTSIDGADLDGDGFDEILVGVGGNYESPADTQTHAPGAVIIFHSNTSTPTVIQDNAEDDFGRNAFFIGDLDLDGVPEFVVTAPYAPNTTPAGLQLRAGLVRVYSGASLTVHSEHRGSVQNSYLGFSGLALDDVNSDGFPDFAALSRGPAATWSLEVFYGVIAVHNTHALAPDAIPGLRMKRIGDIDRDGIDDLAFGGRDNVNNLELVDLIAADGFRQVDRLRSSISPSNFGVDFARLPDTNGDTRPELMVGEPYAIATLGQVTRVELEPCLTTLADGSPLHDLLLVNGTNALPSRRVDLALGEPFTISVAADPTTGQPTDHIIWGLIGVPDAVSVYNVTGGSFLFPPRVAAPALPWLFTLTDSIGFDPAAAFPGYQAPWSLGAPFGISFPIDLTFQGVTISGGNIDITNGILLSVR